MQTDQSHYLDALLKLYLGLPERPSRGRAPPTSALPATFTDGGLRLKPWKRLCCWHPRVVYSAIHLFHRCRRSAGSITSSRSSGKSQPARSHRTIFTTFVTSLNPTSPEIGPRTEPTLSPPATRLNRSFSFTFTWPLTGRSGSLMFSPNLKARNGVFLAIHVGIVHRKRGAFASPF
jgi:hypothetical protein